MGKLVIVFTVYICDWYPFYSSDFRVSFSYSTNKYCAFIFKMEQNHFTIEGFQLFVSFSCHRCLIK